MQPFMSFSSSPKLPPNSVQIPTMSDILKSSQAQGLNIQVSTTGPFFKVEARGGEDKELGRAEGVIRPWFGAKILHLDSLRMRKDTLGMDKSIFGLGLFIGAVAVRHGFDQGRHKAELLAIDDSPLYLSKLVRFYTRMGFKVVHEVDGSSIRDLAHMLVWGGRGTRMDADIHHLLFKWAKRFNS